MVQLVFLSLARAFKSKEKSQKSMKTSEKIQVKERLMGFACLQKSISGEWNDEWIIKQGDEVLNVTI